MNRRSRPAIICPSVTRNSIKVQAASFTWLVALRAKPTVLVTAARSFPTGKGAMFHSNDALSRRF